MPPEPALLPVPHDQTTSRTYVYVCVCVYVSCLCVCFMFSIMPLSLSFRNAKWCACALLLFACWLCCSCRPGGPTTLLTSMRHPCRHCYPYEQRVSARSLRCLVSIAKHVFLFSQAYVVFMFSHLFVRGRFVRGTNFMYKRLYSLFGLGSRCITLFNRL